MSSIEKAMLRRNNSLSAGKSDQDNATKSKNNDGMTEGIDGASKFICNLDYEKLAENGYLVPAVERSNIAEEYRRIKRPLLMNAHGKGAATVEYGNMVMITSALPGEGKTYTSFNLAMSMAMERDITVLLVDSDVVKPGLTNLLGLSDRPGLIDVLLEPDVGLEDVIVATDTSRLKVLPAGRSHPHSTELFASENMARVVKELSARYSDRIVIFDAPPLLAASEASVISQLVGQILVVVESAVTSQGLVKEAVSRLSSDKVIGMVLNKSRLSREPEYYGSYYGASAK